MYNRITFPLDLDPESITVFINKEHALSNAYIPRDLTKPNVTFDELEFSEKQLLRQEASLALEALFNNALKCDLTLYAVSGFRSYNRQYDIFTSNLIQKGREHTLKYSAVPGTSEHQSGLAMDISCSTINFELDEVFDSTPEGIWLAENSYKEGFIIRYPKDKVDITGYEYEPWHIRYVGKVLADFLYENSLSLEEYYNYTPSDDFDFFIKYFKILNCTLPFTIEDTDYNEDRTE